MKLNLSISLRTAPFVAAMRRMKEHDMHDDALRLKRRTLQESMSLLGSLAAGLEAAVGDPANSIAFKAGGALADKLCMGMRRTDDVLEALDLVRGILAANNCDWFYEPFKVEKRAHVVESLEGGEEVMLVFRDCMIRQSLFRFGHAQKGSLCHMMNGFFASALENATGRKAALEIEHAGQNACYKRLIVNRQGR